MALSPEDEQAQVNKRELFETENTARQLLLENADIFGFNPSIPRRLAAGFPLRKVRKPLVSKII